MKIKRRMTAEDGEVDAHEPRVTLMVMMMVMDVVEDMGTWQELDV